MPNDQLFLMSENGGVGLFLLYSTLRAKPHQVSIDFTLPIDTLQGSMSPYHSRCHLAVNFHGKL